MPRQRRRGYPVAALIGLEEEQTQIWDVYSNSVKPDTKIDKKESDYNYYEAIIDQLRDKIKQGTKTILVSATETKYHGFIMHIEKHQRWMITGYELNRVTFEHVEGSANTVNEVKKLINQSRFLEKIKEASSEGLEAVMSVLEKRLNTSEGIDTLRFTLVEAEEVVYGEWSDEKPEYLIVTTGFRDQHKKRTQRLLQIAENRGIKTRIIESGTKYGNRITQFGGLVLLLSN